MDAVKTAEKVVECYQILKKGEVFPTDAANIALSLVMNELHPPRLVNAGFDDLFQQQQEHLDSNCG